MQSVLQTIRRNFLKVEDIARKRKRPQISEATIQRRKDIKKLKHANIYSMDHSGEKTYHSWLDGRRLRSLMLSMQDFRNRNRFTVPIEKKDQDQMKEKLTEYSYYQYWVMRNQEYKFQKFLKKQDQLKQDLDSLPYHLRVEITDLQKQQVERPERPELLQDYNLYYEQTMRINPDDYARDLQIGKRLEKVITEKLGENE